MALSPVNGNLYVACGWELYTSLGLPASPAVYEVNFIGGTANLVNTFLMSAPPESIAFSPDGSKLYVGLGTANTLLVMDPNVGTQLATIPTGVDPASIAINSSGTLGYVANYTSNTISVVNLSSNTVTTTITLPAGALPSANSLSYAPPGSTVGSVAATVNGASFAANAAVAAGSLVSLFGARFTARLSEPPACSVFDPRPDAPDAIDSRSPETPFGAFRVNTENAAPIPASCRSRKLGTAFRSPVTTLSPPLRGQRSCPAPSFPRRRFFANPFDRRLLRSVRFRSRYRANSLPSTRCPRRSSALS
jgi:YVTN family beta-propeller protein